MCRDIAVRRATAGRKSLDDLMRAFYKKYGGTDLTYTTADLENYLNGLGGDGHAGFFAANIYGAEPVPIDKCLSEAGFDAKIVNGELTVSKKPAPSPLERALASGILGK